MDELTWHRSDLPLRGEWLKVQIVERGSQEERRVGPCSSFSDSMRNNFAKSQALKSSTSKGERRPKSSYIVGWTIFRGNTPASISISLTSASLNVWFGFSIKFSGFLACLIFLLFLCDQNVSRPQSAALQCPGGLVPLTITPFCFLFILYSWFLIPESRVSSHRVTKMLGG